MTPGWGYNLLESGGRWHYSLVTKVFFGVLVYSPERLSLMVDFTHQTMLMLIYLAFIWYH